MNRILSIASLFVLFACVANVCFFGRVTEVLFSHRMDDVVTILISVFGSMILGLIAYSAYEVLELERQ